MSPFAEVVAALVAALFLTSVLCAAGVRLRTLSKNHDIAPDLHLAIDFLFGSWLAAFSLLLLGLGQWFTATAIIATCFGLGVIGLWRPRPRDHAAVVAAVPAGLIAPLALAPPFFYDALVYHLALPWQQLQETAITAHVEDLFSTFPPLAQLLYAIPLSFGIESAPAVLHLLSFVIAGAAVAALARRLGAPLGLAYLAAATTVVLPSNTVGPGALPVAALPAAEGFLLIAVVTSLALAIDGITTTGIAAAVGLLLGCAAATRLQGLVWLPIVCVVMVVQQVEHDSNLLLPKVVAPRDDFESSRSNAYFAGSARARRRLTLIGSVAAGWLVGSCPWWLKNAVLLRSPFAPIGWNREGVDTLWRDSGSRVNQLTNGDIASLAALPSGIAGELSGHVGWLAPLLLVSAIAVARGDRRQRLTGAVAVVLFLCWCVTGALTRFLAPTVVILLALAASAAGDSGRKTRVAAITAWLALLTTFFLGLAPAMSTIARAGTSALFRLRSPEDRGRLLHHNPFPAFAAAEGLPPDARVLFVGEARGFGFPRRFIAPSQHDVSPLLALVEGAQTHSQIVAELRAHDFTHLLVAAAELDRLAPRYPVAPWRTARGLERFKQLLAGLSPPVIAVDGIDIYLLSVAGDR